MTAEPMSEKCNEFPPQGEAHQGTIAIIRSHLSIIVVLCLFAFKRSELAQFSDIL
jgi:hypothetical protein